MERRKRKWLKYVKGEEGYLLLSTLLFLVFSGLFSHSMIKIAGNQTMQLRQFSTAYQAKSALNMGEHLLNTYIEEKDEQPISGKIKTSIGNIEISKQSENLFHLELTLENGRKLSKEVALEKDEPKKDTETSEEVLNLDTKEKSALKVPNE